MLLCLKHRQPKQDAAVGDDGPTVAAPTTLRLGLITTKAITVPEFLWVSDLAVDLADLVFMVADLVFMVAGMDFMAVTVDMDFMAGMVDMAGIDCPMSAA